MSKIIVNIEINEDSTKIKESYEVTEYQLAKELFSPVLSKCMRMITEGKRDLAGPQQELPLSQTQIAIEESGDFICQKCLINCPDIYADQKTNCAYYIEKVDHEITQEIIELISQFRDKINTKEGTTLIFAKKLYVTEIKAREVFIQTLNENLRGMEETIDLIFDTDCQAYLYDEKFLENVLMKKYEDELEGYIREEQEENEKKILEQKKIIIAKLTGKSDSEAESAAIDEFKPVKKRSKKQTKND
jgi:Fe-S cluster biosynthesis and repair protein YggX